MDVIFYVLLITFCLYVLIGFIVNAGISKTRGISERGDHNPSPAVSVVVAVRNEEHNISDLLGSLVNQNYSNYEIIIVDDNSTDSTKKLADDFISLRKTANPEIRIIPACENTHNWGPKKNALHTGIEISKGEIIMTTDADCRPQEKWISEMVSFYSDGVGVVAGYTPLKSPGAGLSGRLKGLESLAMAIIAMSFIGLKKPYIAGGGNLSYKKDLYYKLDGFGSNASIASGDDDLFVQRASKISKVRYAVSEGSIVPSFLRDDKYIRRKRRHISVTKYYSYDFIAAGAAVFIFMAALAAALVAGSLLPDAKLLYGSIAVFVLKVALDLYLLYKGSRVLHGSFNIFEVIFTELLVFPYTLILQPISLFGKIRWKDRDLCVSMIPQQ
ncbi:MAG: glycosyltransferase [Syntrophothermus sp.]